MYPKIHSHEDSSCQIQPIPSGPIKVGKKWKIIRGIVIDNQVRPVYDTQSHNVVVYIGHNMTINIRLSEERFSRIPFGIMPTYTATAIIRERNYFRYKQNIKLK